MLLVKFDGFISWEGRCGGHGGGEGRVCFELNCVHMMVRSLIFPWSVFVFGWRYLDCVELVLCVHDG